MAKKNFKEITQNVSNSILEMRKEIPEVLDGFNAMAAAAGAEGALDAKTKKLIALAIAVACRCSPCIGFHTQGAVKAGATEKEVAEVLGMAVYMGGGPSLMYAAETWDAFKEAQGK